MNWFEAILSVFGIALKCWQYLRAEETKKAEAAQNLADQFVKIEAAGKPVMSDMLSRMGRSHWVPWDEVKGSAGVTPPT
jgi:hypothetical protein